VVAIEKFYDDVCTPTVEIRQDGRALLKFVTNHGPIALLLAADTPLLLCERIERVLARSGRATGMPLPEIRHSTYQRRTARKRKPSMRVLS